MLIGNHSAPLSAVLFARGATDTNWRIDGWMGRAGAVEQEREREREVGGRRLTGERERERERETVFV